MAAATAAEAEAGEMAAGDAAAGAGDGAGAAAAAEPQAIVDGVVVPRRRRRALSAPSRTLHSQLGSARDAHESPQDAAAILSWLIELFEGTRPAAAAPTELRPLPWAEAAPPPAAAPSVAALEGVDWAAWAASLSWGGASGVVWGGQPPVAKQRRDATRALLTRLGGLPHQTEKQQSPPLVLWGALHHTVAAAVAEAHASVAAAGQRGPLGDAAAAALASDAAAPALRALLPVARLAVRLFDARSLATSIHLPLGDLLSKGVWQPPPGTTRPSLAARPEVFAPLRRALLCADLSELWLACALVVRDAAEARSPPPRSRSPRSPAPSLRARGRTCSCRRPLVSTTRWAQLAMSSLTTRAQPSRARPRAPTPTPRRRRPT